MIVTYLKIGLFISLLIVSYFIVKKINSYINRDIYEARGENAQILKRRFNTVSFSFQKNDYFKSIFEKRKIKLKKLGNPYNLTPGSYYFLKYGLSIVLLLCFIITRNINLINVLLVLAIFLFIDISYFLRNKRDNEEILNDLPMIYDSIKIQSSAGIHLGIALTEIFDVVKNERLKNNLISLAAEINIKKNIDKAMDHFIENFNLLELESFALAIKQSVKTGKNKELLANQGDLLREKLVDNKDIQTNRNTLQMLVVSIFIFIGISAMMYFSFGKQINDGLNNILN